MEHTEISLDAFVAAKTAELEAFRKHWAKATEKNPTGYPGELPMGDWEDQFLAFMGIDGSRW